MKRILAAFLLLCFCLAGCGGKTEGIGFFAWMDGYLAMHINEELTIAFTLFVDKDNGTLDTSSVQSVAFENLEGIALQNFSITPMDTIAAQKYAGYALSLDIAAIEPGVFKTENLLVTIDHSSVSYPIGDWTFEVLDDAVPPADVDSYIDTWKSPAAGSNPNTFAYEYGIADDTVILKEVWLGETIVVSDSEGLPLSNVLELPQEMLAPLHYIRPKLVFELDGADYTTTGTGYYSGALDIQEDVLEQSKNR